MSNIAAIRATASDLLHEAESLKKQAQVRQELAKDYMTLALEYEALERRSMELSNRLRGLFISSFSADLIGNRFSLCDLSNILIIKNKFKENFNYPSLR